MKDLVTRLRDRWADGNAALEQEAADKIEAQQAALVKCRDALKGVIDIEPGQAAQFWSVSGGVYEAVQCKDAIAEAERVLG